MLPLYGDGGMQRAIIRDGVLLLDECSVLQAAQTSILTGSG